MKITISTSILSSQFTQREPLVTSYGPQQPDDLEDCQVSKDKGTTQNYTLENDYEKR